MKLDIVFEDENFLVLNKPAGILVHPTARKEQDTLVNTVLKEYPQIKKVGDEPEIRPGIVHRLDRDVSGLLVVAKTQTAFSCLKKQFKERKVKKEYIALVYGEIAGDAGIIEFPVGRSKKTGKMLAMPQRIPGRMAVTEYKVIRRFSSFTLLQVRTKTGRMHQIRVHMKAIGHPIAGDKLYKPRKKKIKKLKVKEIPKRIFLHASGLGFSNLEDEWMEFVSDLPVELLEFIDCLEGKCSK